MANPSVSYVFINSTTADASEVNQNFSDLISSLTDGTKSLNIDAITAAGTATFNGNVALGNAAGDTIAINGTVNSNVSFDGGTFVFNESGADKDFRIEGDTDSTLFFCDASTDRIGIGTSSPTTHLTLSKSGLSTTLNATGVNDAPTIVFTAGTLSSPTYSQSQYLYQGEFYMTGIYGATSSGGSAMYVNSSGKLGTGTSTLESKMNIQEIENTDIVYKTRVVTFNYRKTDEDKNYTDDPEEFLSAGAIAEEVEKLDSNFILYKGDKPQGIRYERYIPYLIKAIQEQQAQINELKARLA